MCSNLDPYLMVTLLTLQRLGKFGMKGRQYEWTDADVLADGNAASKAGSKTIFPQGYKEPVPQSLNFDEQAMLMDDHPMMKTYAEMSGDRGLACFEGPMYDALTEGAPRHTLMLGKGRTLPAGMMCDRQHSRIKTSLIQLLVDYPDLNNPVTEDWLSAAAAPHLPATANLDLIDCALARTGKGKDVLLFDRAEVNEVNFTGTAYGRTRKRVNCFVGIQYDPKMLMAMVLCCIKIPHENAELPPLRLAILNFYDKAEAEQLGGRSGRGRGGRAGGRGGRRRGRGRLAAAAGQGLHPMLSIDLSKTSITAGGNREEFCAVDPATIGHKLVVAFDGANNVFGVPYTLLTSRN
ncbi:hypothetical protein FOA52_011957 [Chlamydomonas sp. UWO 241]|nr:hypothetical protein FOA52_011957 [Chlamydomonas sp. UWO 241]